MKKTIIIYLLCICSIAAKAQKYQVFGDVGISTLLFKSTDFSATIDMMHNRNFGLGLGAQTVSTNIYIASRHTDTPTKVFKTSLFLDARCNLFIRKSFIFLFTDLGISLYHQPAIAGVQDGHNNGFYLGLGFGYCYPLTARGMGPYISVKLASDAYYYTEYSPVTLQPSKAGILDGTGVLALGFKF